MVANERWSFRGHSNHKSDWENFSVWIVVAYGGSTVAERKGLNLYEKNIGQFIDHTGILSILIRLNAK